jgi:hypothetical protein
MGAHLTLVHRISSRRSCIGRYPSFVANCRRELYFGLIGIHVLIHAVHGPIFGLAMMEELEHHGYHIVPGTWPAPLLWTEECQRSQAADLHDHCGWKESAKKALS